MPDGRRTRRELAREGGRGQRRRDLGRAVEGVGDDEVDDGVGALGQQHRGVPHAHAQARVRAQAEVLARELDDRRLELDHDLPRARPRRLDVARERRRSAAEVDRVDRAARRAEDVDDVADPPHVWPLEVGRGRRGRRTRRPGGRSQERGPVGRCGSGSTRTTPSGRRRPRPAERGGCGAATTRRAGSSGSGRRAAPPAALCAAYWRSPSLIDLRQALRSRSARGRGTLPSNSIVYSSSEPPSPCGENRMTPSWFLSTPPLVIR